MIKRIVKMSFHPEKVDEFLTLFNQNQKHIRAYKGCEHLELWRDKKDSNIFFTYSHWESEDALNAYRASDLFASVWKNTKVKFNDKPLAWSFDRIDQKLTKET